MGSGHNFSFRKRIEVQGSALLPFEERELEVFASDGISIRLRSLGDAPLKDASGISLWGIGYPDEDAAHDAGLMWTGRIQRALGAIGVAANFGHRAPRMGYLAPATLRTWATDDNAVVMNDSWEVLTFPTDPRPAFIAGSATGIARTHPDVALAAIRGAAQSVEPSPDQTAVHLYAAAARAADVADTRLVLLVAALESLLVRPERSPRSIAHLERLAQLTREDETLPLDERHAIANGISGMRRTSSRSAAMATADTVAEWPFDTPPRKLVSRAFELRHAIVHGGVRAEVQEVGVVAALLQALVGELIAGEGVMAHVREVRHALEKAAAKGLERPDGER